METWGLDETLRRQVGLINEQHPLQEGVRHWQGGSDVTVVCASVTGCHVAVDIWLPANKW